MQPLPAFVSYLDWENLGRIFSPLTLDCGIRASWASASAGAAYATAASEETSVRNFMVTVVSKERETLTGRWDAGGRHRAFK